MYETRQNLGRAVHPLLFFTLCVGYGDGVGMMVNYGATDMNMMPSDKTHAYKEDILMQYNAIFHGFMNNIFQMTYDSFLINVSNTEFRCP